MGKSIPRAKEKNTIRDDSVVTPILVDFAEKYIASIKLVFYDDVINKFGII
jgi:hypothetical protein